MSLAELDSFSFDRRAPDEADLKAVVLDRLGRSERGGEPVVANEYCLGETAVRVDLAVLSKDFIGVEVKSERDSLRRLPHQIAAYGQYFDRIILAVAPTHIPNLNWKELRAVEVWSVSESGRVTVISEPTIFLDQSCRSGLMTADQVRRHRLTSASTEGEIVDAFCAEFERRFGQTSSNFWRSVKGRRITRADIETLSRFKDRRLSVSEWSQAQEDEWAAWAAQVHSLLGPKAA